MSWNNKENHLNVDNMSKSQIQNLVSQISKKGRFGDSTIRNVKEEPNHVNPLEALIIDNYGEEGEEFVAKTGSGTINPDTGLKERFPWLAAAMAVATIGGMYRLAAGKDWRLSTKKWQGRHGPEANIMKAPLTSFQQLKDLYSGKGKFAGVTDIGKAIQALRYNLGGYGEQEATGSDWNKALSGGLSGFYDFNPLKAISERMNPFLKKETAKKEASINPAIEQLTKLASASATEAPSIGQGKDIFALGADVQSKADKDFASVVDAERERQEQDVFETWSRAV